MIILGIFVIILIILVFFAIASDSESEGRWSLITEIVGTIIIIAALILIEAGINRIVEERVNEINSVNVTESEDN